MSYALSPSVIYRFSIAFLSGGSLGEVGPRLRPDAGAPSRGEVDKVREEAMKDVGEYVRDILR